MNDIKCKFQKLHQLKVILSLSLRYLVQPLHKIAVVLVCRSFFLGPNLAIEFVRTVIIEHQASLRDKKVFNLIIQSLPLLQSHDHNPKAQLINQMDHLASRHHRGLFGMEIHAGY